VGVTGQRHSDPRAVTRRKIARHVAPALLMLALWATDARADALSDAVEAVRNHNATRADIQAIARSAHAGNGAACELVAWMLATGTVVSQDRRLAFSWYIEAYRRGLRQSLRDARIVFDRMDLGERASVDTRLLVFLKADAPPPGMAAAPHDSQAAASVRAVVREEAARAKFPLQLAEAVAYVESRFTPDAVSPKGARGVMQIMPATAAGFATEADQLFDTRTNIRLGIQYLSLLIDQYGSVDKALANYVGGTAAGAAYPFVTDEVKSYVDNVLNAAQRYEREPSAGTVGLAGK
jgi:soluble lytic murein transglycosylase-like protein